MSPVSSSTPTCASARWRNARGSMSNSEHGGLVVLTLALRGRVGGGSRIVALTGHGLDVDEPGPRLHTRGRAAGSPCAAGDPRTRTGGRGGAVRGGRRSTKPYISQHSRSCQSAPGIDGHPATGRASDVVVDVGLERDAPVPARRLHRGEHLEAGRSEPAGAVRGLGRAAPATTCRSPASSPPSFGDGQPVDAGDEREVVALELVLGDLGGRAPGVAAAPARRACRTPRLLDARRRPARPRGAPAARRARASSASAGRARPSSVGSAVGGRPRVCPNRLTSANDDRLPAPALFELVVADALVLDALLEQHDPLDQRLGPRRAARARRRRPGRSGRSPLVTEYESQ